MALILLLALSLAVLVQSESSSASATRARELARQNALFGLQVALGQLQQHAGSDQRVTVPATTVFPAKNVVSYTGPMYEDVTFGYRVFAETSNQRSYLGRVETYLNRDERESWDEALNAWWNNGGDSRNPHWTGVFDTSLRVDRASDPDGSPVTLPSERFENGAGTRFGEPNRAQLPVWLVSGNETLGFDPVSDTEYPPGYLTPDIPLPEPSVDPDVIYLVGDGSAMGWDEIASGASPADGLVGTVKARKSEIAFGGQSGSVGNFAYWIGDESVKAHIALRDPYADPDGEPAPGAPKGSAEYRLRLLAPQRNGWNSMTGFAAIGSGFEINPAEMGDTFHLGQFALLDAEFVDDPADTTDPSPLRANFHSATVVASSLFTDVALGGLKKDLTRFLEDGVGLPSGQAIADENLYDSNDPRFAAWNGANSGFPLDDSGIPTWGDLRQWYQDTRSGSITPGERFAPQISYLNFHAGLSYDPATGEINFHVIPAIVLWNPFDAPLAPATYELDVGYSFQSNLFMIASQNVSATDVSVSGTAPDDEGMFRDNLIPTVGGADFFYAVEGIENEWTNRSGGGSAFGARNAASVTGAPGNLLYKWSPFLDGAKGDSLLQDKDENGRDILVDQLMKFRLTTGFSAGESRIFTLGTGPSQDIRNWKPDDRLVLENIFYPDFPASASFPVMRIRANGPAANTTRPSGLERDLVWLGGSIQNFSYLTPSLTLRLSGGERLLDLPKAGDYESTDLTKMLKPQTDSDVSTWARSIPSTDAFATVINSMNTGFVARTHTGAPEPAFPLFRLWMQPFTSERDSDMNGPDSWQIYDAAPVLSRYNLFAPAQVHPLVDGLRNKRFGNNADRFKTVNFLRSGTEAGDQVNWDESQAPDQTAGYSLITYRDDGPSGIFAPQATIPARGATRQDTPVLSLGQLGQANLSTYFWQPAFPIGNSFASPYVDREAIAGIHSREVGRSVLGGSSPGGSPYGTVPNSGPGSNVLGQPVGGNSVLDLSYVLNESLWDRYFTSGVTSSPVPGAVLANSRLKIAEDASPGDVLDIDLAASEMELAGGFNVNSTSKEAWKALLLAFRDLQLSSRNGPENPSETSPIARQIEPFEGAITFTDTDRDPDDYGDRSTQKNYLKLASGYRFLTDSMIDELADRIVDEVRLRGPFLSLSDFVNRRLVAPEGSGRAGSSWYLARTTSDDDTHPDFIERDYDPFTGLSGLGGALQRAVQLSGINGGLNHPGLDGGASMENDWAYALKIKNAADADYSNSNRNDHYTSTGIGGNANSTPKMTVDPALRHYLDSEHVAGAAVGEAGQLLDGSSGFVTQADILGMIGSALTARGDTFLVRTYGDAVDPVSNEVISRVWLEAVVQRSVAPVSPVATTGDDRLVPADALGRRFRVVFIRWLSPDEV